MEKNEVGFNPCDYGFKRLDISHQGLTFFERELNMEPKTKPDFLRLNIYLSQDGAFVTIWSGLFDPAPSEGVLPVNLPPDFDFREMYNQDLFRGYIETDAEANVIFKALRFGDYRAGVLFADKAGCLVCSSLERAT